MVESLDIFRETSRRMLLFGILASVGCTHGDDSSHRSRGTSNALCDASAPPLLIAASANLEDVNSCIAIANDQDTVVIPSGTPTWPSGVMINKAITLKGAGRNSTVITSTASAAITLAPKADIPIRVTDIGFSLGAMSTDRQAIIVEADRSNLFGLTQIRLDHLAIIGGSKTISLNGWVHSLIDHVTFINTMEGVVCAGDDDFSWTRSFAKGEVEAGKANAMFVEDSTFILTGSFTDPVDAEVYVQEGCNMVTRYNTFDSTSFAPLGFLNLVLNDHGNQDYVPLTPPPNFRGQPLHEFYNNTIKVARADVLLGLRGNSYLIHDNTIICSVSCGNVIQLTEEEGWAAGGPFTIQRTVWPAQDQLRNSFIWNNKITPNTNAPQRDLITSDVVLAQPSTDAIFIQENREFFMHPPQAIGGKSSYGGLRPGGSQSAPTSSDTDTLRFVSSGGNAYYPYTPYTYPHPLNQ